MKAKTWVKEFFVAFFILFFAVICTVLFIDPFFHYHKPKTNQYFYEIDNQRCMNDGVIKNFDYDSIIVGTSMTENFKTSEANKIFGGNFIKIPFSGAYYKEINDAERLALLKNPKLKIVIRSIDDSGFLMDKDQTDGDGIYPIYLYDDNTLNDVNYIFNRDVMYSYCVKMNILKILGQEPGITTFDDYSKWPDTDKFGAKAALSGYTEFVSQESHASFTLVDEVTISNNVKQNIVDLADEYPDTEFYYFIPPYSAVYFGNLYNNGNLEREFAAEKYLIEQILPHKNIHLYAFSDDFKLTTDLSNYKDYVHYGEWVNTEMLDKMKEGEGLLTEENYEGYMEKIEKFYENFDYNLLFEQIDNPEKLPEIESDIKDDSKIDNINSEITTPSDQNAAPEGDEETKNNSADSAKNINTNELSDIIYTLQPGSVLDEASISDSFLYFKIYEIKEGDEVFNRINGKSYRPNNDIALSDLRYLKVLYYDFDNQITVGEIIVNKSIAESTLSVFKELFAKKYQIKSMYLVDDFWTGDGASTDIASQAADNTSAFNYRMTTSGKKLSNHALGRAIDINPLENPYIITENGVAHCDIDASAPYFDRSSGLEHIILKDDICESIFEKYGFKWGGDWHNPVDYQHFEKK